MAEKASRVAVLAAQDALRGFGVLGVRAVALEAALLAARAAECRERVVYVLTECFDESPCSVRVVGVFTTLEAAHEKCGPDGTVYRAEIGGEVTRYD